MPLKEMEQKIEVYECAEIDLLLKTFQGIRTKIMTAHVKKEQIDYDKQ